MSCVTIPGLGQFCWPNNTNYTQPPPAGAALGAGTVYVPLSNGGVFGTTNVALFPCQSLNDNTVNYFTFDPTQGYNDPNAISRYTWRVEQPKPKNGTGVYRQPTIRRLLVTYLDLGPVSVTFTISGGNDQGQPVNQSAQASWGNNPATNQLYTASVDILLTCANPQLSVLRMADAGPLAIVQVVMVGNVEEVTV